MEQSPWNRGQRRYKRAHSMDSWLRERDDDLALFHEMQAQERSTFLHPSSDDIDASLSTKFDELSGYHSLMSTPTRISSLDLLTADTGKNDYDWLRTPPGTPLFPSLDQDGPIVNLLHGSVLNRSTSVSRASRLSFLEEPCSKILRNRSPCRPGKASSTSSTNTTVRGRSSSPSRINTISTVRGRSPSPSRINRNNTVRGRSPSPSRISSSPNLCSSVAIRSSTPTKTASGLVLRSTKPLTSTACRTNTTIVRSSSAKAGANKRGSSLSPKSRVWHPASVPGFSLEPPPNLRTSISDRPSLSFRGGSFNSRHGTTSGVRNSCFEASGMSRTRQQPGSANTSKSSSSIFSQDLCSSQTSKCSVNSSCDDDEAEISKPALLASQRESSECTFTAGEVASSENASCKKPMESVTRQLEHRRASQKMFRPFLSSVPASSFYSTRSNGLHCRLSSFSVESSFVISSNENSEQGIQMIPDDENDDKLQCKEGTWPRRLSHQIPAKASLDVDHLKKPVRHHTDLGLYQQYDHIDHARQDGETKLTLDDLAPKNDVADDHCETDAVDADVLVAEREIEPLNDRLCNHSSFEMQTEKLSMVTEDSQNSHCHCDPGFTDGVPCEEGNRRHNSENIINDPSVKLETHAVEVDVLVAERQNVSLNDRLCNHPSVEMQIGKLSVVKEDSQNSHRHCDLGCADGGPCKEESRRHDIENLVNDPSVKFESRKLPESDYRPANFSPSFQSSKNDFLQTGQTLKLTSRVKRETNTRKVLDILSLQEDNEVDHFGKKSCNLNIKLQQQNNFVERDLTKFCGHKQFNSQCYCENQNLNSSYSSKKSERCMPNDGAKAVPSSHSQLHNPSASIFPEHISYVNRITDGGTISQSTGKRVDPLSLRAESENLSSVKKNSDSVEAVSLSFVCSEHLGEQSKGDDPHGHARTISNTTQRSILDCTESITSGLQDMMGMHDKKTDRIKDECCQEPLETVSNFECRLSNVIQGNIMCPDVSSEVVTELSSKEKGLHVREIVANLNFETNYKKMDASSRSSSFSGASEQNCTVTRKPAIDDFIYPSSQCFPDLSTEEVWHERCNSDEPAKIEILNRNESRVTCCEQDESVNEREQKDVACEPSAGQKGEPNRNQEIPEVAELTKVEIMVLESMNDAMQNSSMPQQLEQQDIPLDNVGEKTKLRTISLTDDLKVEAARDTVLFCSSIVHDIIDRAASMTIEKDLNSTSTPNLADDLISGYVSRGRGCRSLYCDKQRDQTAGTCSAVRRTLTYVQKNHQMVQQTPVITCQQSLMDKTGTAVLKGSEAYTLPVIEVLQRDCVKARKVKFRCRCHIM